MPTGMSIIHCDERGEAGEKPFPRGLCESCNSVEKRKEMHEENVKVFASIGKEWFCKVCTKLSVIQKK